MRKLTAYTATLLLFFAAGSAYADIYGYVDAQGNAHFSTEKLDKRYHLFARGAASFHANSTIGGEARPMSPALFRYLSSHPNLKKFEPMLDGAAKEYGLQPALLKAIMAAESGFNPAAVSPKGAIGLMQIMPETAERYGLQADKQRSLSQKLADPQTNIRLSARYLRDLHKLFPGQPELVIASYNAGEGAVQKYRNSIPPYPETRNYVQLVSQFYRIYQPSGDIPATAAADGARNGKRIHMIIP
ncbi:MAG: transglycosylase SLT domain-containing protein, partial [Proteobacteria bacterium]|nr:transglycosylase SLT domain-containing protein [Pseudomonadota bacterium]